MKIFNWVQRKLHQNVIKDGLGKNVKKVESSEIDKNTKAILEQVGLVDVLENWVDGVLTIGTFGFDTLKCSDDDKQNDGSFVDVGDKDGSGEDDCVDLDNGAGDNYDDETLAGTDHRDEEMDPLISVDKFDYQNADHLGFGNIIDADDLITAVDCVELAPTTVEVDQIHGQKRRTTLAELFMADTDYTPFEKSSSNCLDEIDKYKLNRSKRHVSLAKKIMSRGDKGQDSRPIKKIHQMMKRMLKRKIHPDVDVGKLCKSEGQNKPTKKNQSVESIHLLNLPGPVI